MKRFSKWLLTLILCIASVFSLCIVPASAARVCEEGDIVGDGSGTFEFYVSVGSQWWKSNGSVKLSQKQGSLTRDAWDGERTEDTYGLFHVYVYKKSNDQYEYVTGYDWEGSSKTIPDLKKGASYKIKVVPATVDELADAHPVKYSAYIGLRQSHCGTMEWEKFPKWSISSSKNIDSFSFSFTCL